MLIVHVQVHVKPEHIEAFKLATIENASHSVQEPGIARFDVVQQADDPSRFLLLEALPRHGSHHAPQSHRALPCLGRKGGGHAGRAAQPRGLR